MFIEVHATPNINRSKEAHAPHKSTPKMHAKNAQTHAKNACHRIPCQRNACNHNTVQTIANKFAPECTKPTRHAHVQLPVHGQLEISSRAVSLEGWHLRFPERPRSEPPPTPPCQSHFSLGRTFWTHFLILGPIFVFWGTAPTGQRLSKFHASLFLALLWVSRLESERTVVPPLANIAVWPHCLIPLLACLLPYRSPMFVFSLCIYLRV